MTMINEIPEGEHRERLRREILGNVAARAEDENASLNRIVTYLGLVCSGATIALLSFIGQQVKTGISALSIWAFCCLAGSLLAFAALLYWHFQLHSSRRALSAEMAQRFFMREASLEDVLESYQMLTSKWLFRLLFWVPFALLFAGLALGVVALFGARPTPFQ